jgi:Uma2 family endonuclease
MSTEFLDTDILSNVDVPRDVDMVTTLHVGPRGLDRYLKLVGDRKGPLVKFHDGSLTLVSPSYRHDRSSDQFDDLIKTICDVLGIDSLAAASTLFRRPGMAHGIEADRSYYIANEPAVRGVQDEIDLSVYPPPDLMVEIVATHDVARTLMICRELRVPEVWVYRVRKRSLEFLVLDADGKYAPAPTSRAFPFLTPADVLPWAKPHEGESDRLWRARLRAWVRDVLGPRARA